MNMNASHQSNSMNNSFTYNNQKANVYGYQGGRNKRTDSLTINTHSNNMNNSQTIGG